MSVLVYILLFARRNVECGAPNLTWKEAMTREDIDAAIISTENDTHEGYIR